MSYPCLEPWPPLQLLTTICQLVPVKVSYLCLNPDPPSKAERGSGRYVRIPKVEDFWPLCFIQTCHQNLDVYLMLTLAFKCGWFVSSNFGWLCNKDINQLQVWYLKVRYSVISKHKYMCNIMAYSSMPYVGMAPKKNGGPIKSVQMIRSKCLR